MKAYIVTDLGFGDAGKGSIVDFLCEAKKADLVVRYSGGAQASHTVVRGVTHQFHMFGSGTLLNVPTFLSQYTVVDPYVLIKEANDLSQLCNGTRNHLLTIHPSCLVTTFLHRLVNRHRELEKGASKHGSCGLGIGAAMEFREKFPDAAISVRDVFSTPETLGYKVAALVDWTKDTLNLPRHWSPDKEELDTTWSLYSEILNFFTVDERPATNLKEESTVVFEGSQGLLLDPKIGFFPHVTWADLTSFNARKVARSLGAFETIENIGVTRCYSTRHGEGPFPSFSQKLTTTLEDPNNPENCWQGGMRFGALDLPLLAYACSADAVNSIAVTCLDVNTPTLPVITGRAIEPWKTKIVEELQKFGQEISLQRSWSDLFAVVDIPDVVSNFLGMPVSIQSWGPRAKDKKMVTQHDLGVGANLS